MLVQRLLQQNAAEVEQVPAAGVGPHEVDLDSEAHQGLQHAAELLLLGCESLALRAERRQVDDHDVGRALVVGPVLAVEQALLTGDHTSLPVLPSTVLLVQPGGALVVTEGDLRGEVVQHVRGEADLGLAHRVQRREALAVPVDRHRLGVGDSGLGILQVLQALLAVVVLRLAAGLSDLGRPAVADRDALEVTGLGQLVHPVDRGHAALHTEPRFELLVQLHIGRVPQARQVRPVLLGQHAGVLGGRSHLGARNGGAEVVGPLGARLSPEIAHRLIGEKDELHLERKISAGHLCGDHLVRRPDHGVAVSILAAHDVAHLHPLVEGVVEVRAQALPIGRVLVGDDQVRLLAQHEGQVGLPLVRAEVAAVVRLLHRGRVVQRLVALLVRAESLRADQLVQAPGQEPERRVERRVHIGPGALGHALEDHVVGPFRASGKIRRVEVGDRHVRIDRVIGDELGPGLPELGDRDDPVPGRGDLGSADVDDLERGARVVPRIHCLDSAVHVGVRDRDIGGEAAVHDAHPVAPVDSGGDRDVEEGVATLQLLPRHHRAAGHGSLGDLGGALADRTLRSLRPGGDATLGDALAGGCSVQAVAVGDRLASDVPGPRAEAIGAEDAA